MELTAWLMERPVVYAPLAGESVWFSQRGQIQHDNILYGNLCRRYSCCLRLAITTDFEDHRNGSTTVLIQDYPHILSILIFLPLAGSLLLLFVQNEFFCPLLGAWLSPALTALLSLALLFRPLTRAQQNFSSSSSHTWIEFTQYQLCLGVDGISILLVLLTTLIMPFCVLASWTYIKTRVPAFMICLLIMETAMIGVFVALDFVLFYILWEAMLIPCTCSSASGVDHARSTPRSNFFSTPWPVPSCCWLAIIWLYKTNNY